MTTNILEAKDRSSLLLTSNVSKTENKTEILIQSLRQNRKENLNKPYKNDVLKYFKSWLVETNNNLKSALNTTWTQTLDEELCALKTQWTSNKSTNKTNTIELLLRKPNHQNNPDVPMKYQYIPRYHYFSDDYKYAILADIRDSSNTRFENYETLIERLYATFTLMKTQKFLFERTWTPKVKKRISKISSKTSPNESGINKHKHRYSHCSSNNTPKNVGKRLKFNNILINESEWNIPWTTGRLKKDWRKIPSVLHSSSNNTCNYNSETSQRNTNEYQKDDWSYRDSIERKSEGIAGTTIDKYDVEDYSTRITKNIIWCGSKKDNSEISEHK